MKILITLSCFYLILVYSFVRANESCGISNEYVWSCLDPEMPHCCGYTEDGKALCCESDNYGFLSLHGHSPEHCGMRNGHDWYCINPNTPHCCGFTDDGTAVCCNKMLKHLSNDVESCGKINGISHFCPFSDMPHCCGFTNEGKNLCCNKEYNTTSPHPQHCGRRNGTDWYCPSPKYPYCCGFNQGGKALCCKDPVDSYDDEYYWQINFEQEMNADLTKKEPFKESENENRFASITIHTPLFWLLVMFATVLLILVALLMTKIQRFKGYSYKQFTVSNEKRSPPKNFENPIRFSSAQPNLV